MGTRIDLVFPMLEEEIVEEVCWVIQQEVERLHVKLSFFEAESTISHINREAWKKEVELDPEMYEILSLCRHYNKRTIHQFDITMRPAYDWLKNRGKPEAAAWDDVKEAAGFDKVVLNDQNKTIALLHRDTKIDLGGFGKGFALKNVVEICQEHAIQDALINFGNSTIYGLGTHPKGDCWRMGIQNIYKSTEMIHAMDIRDACLSFSGNSFASGKYHTHIMNPLSFDVVDKTGTMAVKSSDPLDAEIYSTALFAATEEKKLEILSRIAVEEVIEVKYEEENKYTINQYYHEAGKIKQKKVC